MSKPNNTVAAFRNKHGKSEAVVNATNERVMQSDAVQDMEKFQNGQMTAEEFQKKWG